MLPETNAFSLPEFDHAVICVPDLKQTIDQFTNLGFAVVKGGSHGVSENALIPFRNSAYIELIAAKSSFVRHAMKVAACLGIADRLLRSKHDVTGRLMKWFAQPYGLVDWCIRSEMFLPQSNGDGINDDSYALTKPKIFGRTTLNGDYIKWYLQSSMSSSLPFMISDADTLEKRVPLFEDGMHKNGAHSIKALRMPQYDFAQVTIYINWLRRRFDQQDSDKQPGYGDPVQLFVNNGVDRLVLELQTDRSNTEKLPMENTYDAHICLTQ